MIRTLPPQHDRFFRPVPMRQSASGSTLGGPGDEEQSSAAKADDKVKLVQTLADLFGFTGIGSIFGNTHIMRQGQNVALQALWSAYQTGKVNGNMPVLIRLEFSNNGQDRRRGERRDEVRNRLEQIGADIVDGGGRVHWDVRIPIRLIGELCPGPGPTCWQWVHGIQLHESAGDEIIRLVASLQRSGAPTGTGSGPQTPGASLPDTTTGSAPGGTTAGSLVKKGVALIGSMVAAGVLFGGVNLKDFKGLPGQAAPKQRKKARKTA